MTGQLARHIKDHDNGGTTNPLQKLLTQILISISSTKPKNLTYIN